MEISEDKVERIIKSFEQIALSLHTLVIDRREERIAKKELEKIATDKNPFRRTIKSLKFFNEGASDKAVWASARCVDLETLKIETVYVSSKCKDFERVKNALASAGTIMTVVVGINNSSGRPWVKNLIEIKGENISTTEPVRNPLPIPTEEEPCLPQEE